MQITEILLLIFSLRLVAATSKCTFLKAKDYIYMSECTEKEVFENLTKYFEKPTEASFLLCDFSNFNRSFLENWTNLMKLKLKANRIRTLRNRTFAKNVGIERLAIQYDVLEAIEVDAFEGLSNLTQLQLNNNKLTVLFSCFRHLLSLQILTLSENKLLFLSKNHFNQNFNLKSIALSYNNVSFIEDGTFDNIFLENINFKSNQLTQLFRLEIEKANFAENKMKEFYIRENLTRLDISRNVLESLLCDNDMKMAEFIAIKNHLSSWECISNMTLLQHLNLKNNNFSTLSIQDMKNLKKLQSFGIEENYLHFLDPTDLKPLVSLKGISLDAFTECENLKNFLPNLKTVTFKVLMWSPIYLMKLEHVLKQQDIRTIFNTEGLYSIVRKSNNWE